MKLKQLLLESNNYDLIKEFIPTVNSIHKLISTDIQDNIEIRTKSILLNTRKILKIYDKISPTTNVVIIKNIIMYLNKHEFDFGISIEALNEIITTLKDHITSKRKLTSDYDISAAQTMLSTLAPMVNELNSNKQVIIRLKQKIHKLQDISNHAHKTKNVPI